VYRSGAILPGVATLIVRTRTPTPTTPTPVNPNFSAATTTPTITTVIITASVVVIGVLCNAEDVSVERVVASGTRFVVRETGVNGPNVVDCDLDSDPDPNSDSSLDEDGESDGNGNCAVGGNELVATEDGDVVRVRDDDRVPVGGGVNDLDLLFEVVALRDKESVRDGDGDPHRPSVMATDSGLVIP
jgi:hypothetical protein